MLLRNAKGIMIPLQPSIYSPQVKKIFSEISSIQHSHIFFFLALTRKITIIYVRLQDLNSRDFHAS